MLIPRSPDIIFGQINFWKWFVLEKNTHVAVVFHVSLVLVFGALVVQTHFSGWSCFSHSALVFHTFSCIFGVTKKCEDVFLNPTSAVKSDFCSAAHWNDFTLFSLNISLCFHVDLHVCAVNKSKNITVVCCEREEKCLKEGHTFAWRNGLSLRCFSQEKWKRMKRERNCVNTRRVWRCKWM